MTSARDAPKGKGDVSIGISKVPDSRLDALTTMFSENWFDTNFSNSERFFLITSALELSFRDALIKAGTYVDGGFDVYKNADNSGVVGPAFFGKLRGWTFVKIHPEFMPKVFVDASNVVDPSPTLTGVGTAASRTLKQVVALAAYKGAAQTHDFFADKKQADGGVRGDFTEYVQHMSYDAWVIDQMSDGIVPIFLPADLDGNGTTDVNYTPVNDSFTRVAAALQTARAQLGTAGSFYPASGPNVNPARPGWYEQPYDRTNAINQALTVKETGDSAKNYPALPGDSAIDLNEISGLIAAVTQAAAARANSTAVTLNQVVKYTNGQLYQVTTAGTTAGAQPSTVGVDIGEIISDGTASVKRIL
jgi:hypothetical protein